MSASEASHVYVTCSNCRAALLDILVLPGAATHRVRANCPFCGDRSFEKTVGGQMFPAGYATPKPDDPTDVMPSTQIDDCDYLGEPDGPNGVKVQFTLRKAGAPVYLAGG